MEWTDSALREYLLGSSSSEAAERMEVRLLDDDELFAALRGAEDDLFDDCARGRLDDAALARFLERYGHETARRRFAGAFAHRTASASASRPTAMPFARRRWIPLAAAAALILMAGALYTRLEAPAPIVARPQPQPRTIATAPPVVVPFAVTLTLGTSRAAATATTVTIPKGTTRVTVNVRLDPADRYEMYDMQLRGAGDRMIWSASRLPAAAVDGHLTVATPIPAAFLKPGTYELVVRGLDNDLGFLPLTIRWSP